MKTKPNCDEAVQHLTQEQEEALKILGKNLTEKYPLGVPRKKIGIATGHILHPRTEANSDCSGGNPILGSFKIGRQKIYPIAGIIQRIKSKMVTTESDGWEQL